ncbi:MAG: hypothetical protein ACRD0V_21000 [Acidimicrobiales bacterium]
MPRHRFDPVALVFGAVFVAAGSIVLAGGELIEEGRALVPAGLIALGVALLVHVGRRARPSATVPQTTPGVAGDQDFDALFAPVDDARTDWDRTHPSTGPTPEADVTQADVTETDATATGATEADATDVDATEVVDPTERYPRPEPE